MNTKNFRVAQCLENGVVKEFAIFADGSKKKELHKDENGNKYFRIYNPYVSPLASFKELRFYNRIKDAIQAIRDDYADAIRCSNQTNGGFIEVIRFVDEKVGKEYREKTLKGWKNTKFAYALRAGYKNSFKGYSLIAKDGEVLSFLSNPMKYATFETEEEAEVFEKKLLKKAQNYVQRVADGEYFDSVMNDVDVTEGKCSVVRDFIFDLLDEDVTGFSSESHELNEYGYSICQCIVPVREDVIENEWYAQANIVGLQDAFPQYKNVEYENIKDIIVSAFSDFYKNSPKFGKFSCKTDIDASLEVKSYLFEKWLTCVAENKELLYPDTVA